ncbi:Myosin regulatory light chain cdc4 [Psilocybe cubensis]|uniref:Myosin regulatory light chain cdc4 n=2 Tax=Psilocybe cubensis TaxID=181762 RepID=A0ACB8GJP1_PSICU|nr:Myosin regulatory light chain cdc4 [Psilocybe cubensis]KAH9475923.1 Myosin regulatory light chain cdc4 [Psilocybe cubensis]
MDVDPLADTVPPRYAIESDEEEDEFNPLHPNPSPPTPTQYDVKIVGDLQSGKPLEVASGDAGRYWARGAQLGEQIGAVYVDKVQIGLLFTPTWTSATVLISEPFARLPLPAMHPYAAAVLDALSPTSLAVLDTYPTPTYATDVRIPAHDAPVRYLTTDEGLSFSDEEAKPFEPPNLVAATSAAFLTSSSPSSSSSTPLTRTLILLPTPHIPPSPPRTLSASSSTSALSQDNDDDDVDWSTQLVNSAQRLLFRAIGKGEDGMREWVKPSNSKEDVTGGVKRRKGAEVGEGGINLHNIQYNEYKEAFALFDKRGTGAVPRETLGDLLRALGQNPTQAEVAEIVAAAPRDVDYKTFLTILNRPDGFKPAGTPEEFIRGFQVFDKEGNGFIGAGELRYVLTQLGEKMTDEEVDELLKGVQVGADGNVNYESFVRTILSQ